MTAAEAAVSWPFNEGGDTRRHSAFPYAGGGKYPGGILEDNNKDRITSLELELTPQN